MPTVSRSVIVSHPAERMFELVDLAEDYPRFLPWCSGVTLYERSETITHARIDIDYKGLKSHVATRNTKRAPEHMRLSFSDGPFERLEGEWHFHALGECGCRIAFSLEYAFSNRAIEMVLGPVFDHIATTFVERFVERADALAAAGPPA
jgi:ribosome-associated toxin RatA of RatAB toxin-antitoxin module